jgi:retron-type reverse transcriptase
LGKLLHFCRYIEAVETIVLSLVDMKDQTAHNGPKLLDELRFGALLDPEIEKLVRAMRAGDYRPQVIRRVFIPKPGST